MWAHIYGEGRSSVVTAFYLRTFFGVDGVLVAEALVELGFLESADGGWRVRGAGRYTRLAEVRREAGRKGAEVTNRQKSANAAAKPGKRSASADSDAGPDEAKEEACDGRQLPAKGPAKVGKCRGKTEETDVLPRQKAALDPRSDMSSLSGKTDHAHESAVSAPPQPGPGGAGQGRTQIQQPDTAPAAMSPDPPPSPPVRPVEERPPDCPPDLWEALTHPRPQTELEKRCLALNPRDYDATNRDFRAWAEERNTTHRALRDWVATVQAEQSHGRRKVLIHAGPPADSWPRARPSAEPAEVTA